MIETTLKEFQKELQEEVDGFELGEDFKIRHFFDEKENRIVNAVIVQGKSYSFGNLMPKYNNEIEHKRYLKRFAKLSVYKALSAYLDKKLPWGALTGIRPTKLAYAEIENGNSFEDFFISTMKVSEEKTELVKDTIKTQEGIYEKREGFTDFFVFIPFCPSRCEYCSFISQDIKSAKNKVDEYIDALICEIKESAKFIKNLRSIYIGGGTPVSLSDDRLERILNELDKINTGVEFTVEAGRPDVITESNLALLKKHNVTRICINPQTFNDKTLTLIGRNHSSADIEEKFKLAKGKFIINMDIIAGLPNETVEDFKLTVQKTLNLMPDNITVHTLCVKRGSYLSNTEKRVECNEIESMVDYAKEELYKNGYRPYYLYRQKYMAGNLENVGYTLEGKACVYNIDVMEEISDNIACGAGAVSKFVNIKENRIERYGNPKDVPTYIAKIETINREKATIKRKSE